MNWSFRRERILSTLMIPKEHTKVYLGIFGFIAGASTADFGDLATAMNSAEYFAGGQRTQVRENVLRCTLEPGEELPVTVKPLRLKVKVKVGK